MLECKIEKETRLGTAIRCSLPRSPPTWLRKGRPAIPAVSGRISEDLNSCKALLTIMQRLHGTQMT